MTFGPVTIISPSSGRSGSSHASVSMVTLTPLATRPTHRSLEVPGPDHPFAATSGEVSVIKRNPLIGKRRAGKIIEPGDTIVVPLDTDDKRFEGIKLFSEVTQIIYQLSLGVAAVDSLRN